MDELRKQLIEKAGISEDQATISIETMAGFIKQRVPQIIHSQLDKIIAGMSLEESIRNQMEDIGSEVKGRSEELARDLKDAFESAFKSEKSSGKE